MAITNEDVQKLVNTNAADLPRLLDCLTVAKQLLDKYLEDNSAADSVPDEVYDRAHVAVTQEMFNQDKAPNGVLNQVYDLGDGGVASTPVRISADPMRPAYPVLSMWIGPVVG